MRVEKYFLEVDNKGRVQKAFNIFSFLISYFPFQKGFTLIEMLVVFAIIGSLTIAGVNSFFSFSQKQDFQTTVSDVSHALNDIRSRALSQVKPSQCGTAMLNGYEFTFPAGGSATDYQINVWCGGTSYLLFKKNLPSNITFTADSATSTFFKVATGTVTNANTIKISGHGMTSTITINSNGVVSVQ